MPFAILGPDGLVDPKSITLTPPEKPDGVLIEIFGGLPVFRELFVDDKGKPLPHPGMIYAKELQYEVIP